MKYTGAKSHLQKKLVSELQKYAYFMSIGVLLFVSACPVKYTGAKSHLQEIGSQLQKYAYFMSKD